jgi:hypothetical protein
MTGKQKCVHCGKDAIGVESFGCCTAYVCREHASALLLELGPGKTLSTGECYLERFGTPKENSSGQKDA